MEKFLNKPGLQHLAENIFLNLSPADLKKCQIINQFASQILDNPMFWIKKLIRNGLSEEHQNEWIKAIQSETNFEKKNIVDYLSWNSMKKNCFHLSCYNKPAAQEDFKLIIWRAAKHPLWMWKGYVELVKILAPLTDNPNAPDKPGNTQISWAAGCGNTEIVKILAPLTDNPNGPNNAGYTPIYFAEYYGHTEIVKILASFDR